MEYLLKITMTGPFPGSPDHDYVLLREDEAMDLYKRFSGRWRDTPADYSEA